jgi:exonuclease SbcC
MIELTLRNFQSHNHSEIQIPAGITAILGDNDSGKTAVVRALRWLLWNRPSGESFRSHWGGPTEVLLKTDHGWISRIRDDKRNVYVINGQVLNAVKLQVPREISDFFKVDRINFQFQSDPPFLLGSSPGERANYIQKITRMNVIFIAEDLLRQKIKRLNADIVHLKSQAEALSTELSRYPDLPQIYNEIQRLKRKEEKLEKLKQSLNNLTQRIEDHYKIQYEIQTLKVYMKLSKRINRLDQKISQKEDLIQRYNRIKGTLSEFRRVLADLNNTKTILDQLKARWNEILPEVCPICGRPLNSSIYPKM